MRLFNTRQGILVEADSRYYISKDAGGGDFYARVYDADRTEIFFKATAARTVGPGDNVLIRRDSQWINTVTQKPLN